MRNPRVSGNYRSTLSLAGNKKAGRKFSSRLSHAAEIFNRLTISWTGLSEISCGKSPSQLLLFGSGLLFRDSFLDRLFRRWGLGGFFGHGKNLDMFSSDGTQIFPSRHRFVSAPTRSVHR
jgi:hypothetical protein